MSDQGGRSKSAKQNLRRNEFRLRNRGGGGQSAVEVLGKRRHSAQRAQIEDVWRRKRFDPQEQLLFLSRYQRGVYLSGPGATPQNCCLFNVIVAFDWNPGYYELELLRITCDEAANLLFDVTDGYMTFHRIIVGGPELMPCADIQIFSSNRLYPRSWVDGLNNPVKYQPIRVGRGYWRKNTGRAEPWHKGYGAAVLVHEWLHYACGLKDSYVGLERVVGGRLVEANSKHPDAFALPKVSPIVNTLMANLDSTELLDEKQWERLAHHQDYRWFEIPSKHQPRNVPPRDAPSPLFDMLGTAKEDPEDDQQVLLDWEDAELKGVLDQRHCWIYVLVPVENDRSEMLIAQGSYEIQPEGYRIIGARPGARLLLVGQLSGVPKVCSRTIKSHSEGRITFEEKIWCSVTPAHPLPLIAVSVVGSQTETPYTLRVDVTPSDGRKWICTVFPLGQQGGIPAIGKPGGPYIAHGIRYLDGHVLLSAPPAKSGHQPEIVIAHFSIGGSPGAAFPAGPNPVPAGSSDGNAMVFFYDEAAAKLGTLGASGAQEAFEKGSPSASDSHAASPLRIITTTNLLATPEASCQSARSYTFAVTTNMPLPTGFLGKPLYYPTLVLYFDQDSKRNSVTGVEEKGSLVIHRSVGGLWEPVPAARQVEDGDRLLVATQLKPATDPGLFSVQPYPEYYRLFFRNPGLLKSLVDGLLKQ
jgi:hypothetical protein